MSLLLSQKQRLTYYQEKQGSVHGYTARQLVWKIYWNFFLSLWARQIHDWFKCPVNHGGYIRAIRERELIIIITNLGKRKDSEQSGKTGNQETGVVVWHETGVSRLHVPTG